MRTTLESSTTSTVSAASAGGRASNDGVLYGVKPGVAAGGLGLRGGAGGHIGAITVGSKPATTVASKLGRGKGASAVNSDGLIDTCEWVSGAAKGTPAAAAAAAGSACSAWGLGAGVGAAGADRALGVQAGGVSGSCSACEPRLVCGGRRRPRPASSLGPVVGLSSGKDSAENGASGSGGWAWRLASCRAMSASARRRACRLASAAASRWLAMAMSTAVGDGRRRG